MRNLQKGRAPEIIATSPGVEDTRCAFNETISSCPACGGDTRHNLRFKKNGSEIYQCLSCGLGRAQNHDFDASRYYTAGYFNGEHTDGYSDYQGSESVLRQEFSKTVDFVRRFRPSGHLLEIGCAYGFFLEEAKQYYTISGIELAGDAVEHCRRLGLKVLEGPVDSARLDQLGKQDVIVLLDVIEHLSDPFSSLMSCVEHLNHDGIIVITTGDFGSIPARIAGKAWRLMTPPQHLWYFSAESMRRLSTRIGLQVEHIDHPWKFVPASLVLFQLRRMIGMKPSRSLRANSFGVPINLFDAMRVVLRKT